MGTSWPGMTRLELAGYAPYSARSPGATLRGVVRLVSLYPRLLRLKLVIDAPTRTTSAAGDDSLRGLVHDRLQMLQVGMPYTDRCDVIMRCEFPGLRWSVGLIRGYSTGGVDRYSQWWVGVRGRA